MRLGTDFKLYLDPSGVGGSSWTEFTYIEDNTLGLERNVAEIANRASDWIKVLTGKRKATVSFTATFKLGNTQYEALRDAFHNNTDIGIAVMSGTITDAGEEGLQADCKVTKFERAEPLQDAVKCNVELMPSAESTTEPAYSEIST
jgi:hypothetical protein